MKYQTTLLEDSIKEFYQKLNIYTPKQLSMREIARKLNIKLTFINISSRTYKGEIIIDSRLSPEEQWADFAHELCHVLLQYGNQIITLNSLFLEYQEWKANNFALHFCVPTFMLLEYKINSINEGVPLIKDKFGVRKEIAEKKLDHFRNQLIQSNL